MAAREVRIFTASVVLLAGCLANGPVPSANRGPEICSPNQVRLVAGRSGAAAGTMVLTFRAELLKAPPCLILTWPAVEISNGAGTVLASGPGDATASPPLTLLVTSLEFHLGWASWCGPYPDGPFDALVGLPGDASVSLALPAGFGPSSCMGAPTIVYVEPGW